MRLSWLPLVLVTTGLVLASCSSSTEEGYRVPVVVVEAGALDSGGPKLDGSADQSSPATCQPEACPGTDTECSLRACKEDVCSTAATAAGIVLKAQKAGDCRTAQCDGVGGITSVVDDGDKPDDQNPCTIEDCDSGTVTSSNAPKDTPCGASLRCDGVGTCVGCTTASECPGANTECRTRTCVGGKCGVINAVLGKVLTAQVDGDCLKLQCDGAGNTQTVVDDTDVPVDGDQCTLDTCTNGAPTNPFAPPGTICNQNGGSVCDSAGSCVQCIVPSTCPGVDDECGRRTCIGNVCGFSFTDAGFVVSSQTPYDCKENQCDGVGHVVAVNADTDPPEDGNQCTQDVCTAGVPSHVVTPNAPCLQAGGSVCSAAGACVECVSATTCPGTDDACQQRTCTNNTCGMSFAQPGTMTPTQTAGDCKRNQCNDSGGIVTVNDDADVPIDSNQCTTDVCTSGVPSNQPVAQGTPCNQNGGTACNPTGSCVP